MTPRFSVAWAEVAREDLWQIIEYIAADRPQVALQQLDRIEERAVKLESLPDRGRPIPELRRQNIDDRYRELIISPYRLIYRLDVDRVTVLAVFDRRRNLEDLILERVLRS